MLTAKEKKALYDKEYRAKKKEQISSYLKAYYKKHADKIKERSAKRKVDRPTARLYAARWRAKNRAMCCFYSMKYYASKLQRTPKWLTEEQKQQILEHYKIAEWATKEFGHKVEVDHIIPLQGEIVSGLHVPWNLQSMSKTLNASKRNKLEVLCV